MQYPVRNNAVFFILIPENSLVTFFLVLRMLLYRYVVWNLDNLHMLRKSDAKGLEGIKQEWKLQD